LEDSSIDRLGAAELYELASKAMWSVFTQKSTTLSISWQ